MSHHHKLAEEGAQQLCEACEARRNFYILAGSILLAAILVSASIFYNVRVVLKYQDNLLSKGLSAVPAAAQNVPSAQAAQQPSVPSQPSGPVTVAARDDAPVLGSKNAKVTMYEFSDFQCPFCQKFFNETLGAIKSKYIDTGKVKFVYRHFPLPFHSNAQKAAEAAECANRQGKFWPYHDLLFKNGQGDGTNLDVASLKKYAGSLGLNSGTLGLGKNKFNRCLDGGETADIVKKDSASGTSAGVSGTPTLFVNGQKIVGAQPIDVFSQAIEAALK